MGGDEVPEVFWEKSPAYILLRKNNPSIQSTEDLWYYYYGRVNKILNKGGCSLRLKRSGHAQDNAGRAKIFSSQS
jgi:hypothetical protein